jgi:hypothetical protein
VTLVQAVLLILGFAIVLASAVLLVVELRKGPNGMELTGRRTAFIRTGLLCAVGAVIIIASVLLPE